MARPVTGIAYLGDARAFRDNAKTAEDLRLALAVLLPLEQGLSIKQTADSFVVSLPGSSALEKWLIRVMPCTLGHARSRA